MAGERVEYVVLDGDGEDYVATIVGEHWTDEAACAEARRDLVAYEKLHERKGSIIKRTITEAPINAE